jgi:glycosyltransferase involved in cell wall biosynthesis
MRVLYLNHNVVGRGTFVRAARLARELVALGHEVTVVTTSVAQRIAGREREWFGVRIVEAPDLMVGPARAGWDPWNTGWRMQRLARERYDLIHSFDCRPVAILPALVQRRRSGAPLFTDWADWWGRGGIIRERSSWPVRTFFGPVETWFEEAFRTTAIASTTISETLRQRCIGLGVAPERVLVLPNGCAPPPAVTPARGEARRALQLPDDPLILHLGAMQTTGPAFLFNAFRRVRAQVTTARLALIAFRGTVPPDLRPFVHSTGFIDDERILKLWLAAADVGVIPLSDTISSRARWPSKLSEYLEAGLPVVMTRVGEAAQLVERSGAGTLSEPSAGAFAARLVDTLSSQCTRTAMSARGRALARGELSWSRLAQRLLAFYHTWPVTASTRAGG